MLLQGEGCPIESATACGDIDVVSEHIVPGFRVLGVVHHTHGGNAMPLNVVVSGCEQYRPNARVKQSEAPKAIVFKRSVTPETLAKRAEEHGRKYTGD